jgi:hypothetical protein
MPSPDPFIYPILNLAFAPYDSGPGVTPTVQEYFKAGDTFTITGFGSEVSLKQLSFLDTNFSLTGGGSAGSTILTFTYDPGSPDLFTGEIIGAIKIDATIDAPFLTINYFDHLLIGGTTSVPDSFPTNPDYGPNLIPTTLVPEPSSIALLTLGTGAGLYLRRRSARRNAG